MILSVYRWRVFAINTSIPMCYLRRFATIARPFVARVSILHLAVIGWHNKSSTMSCLLLVTPMSKVVWTNPFKPCPAIDSNCRRSLRKSWLSKASSSSYHMWWNALCCKYVHCSTFQSFNLKELVITHGVGTGGFLERVYFLAAEACYVFAVHTMLL